MFVRVVRFTDVDMDRVNQMLDDMNTYDGPPEGVKSSGIQIVLDRDQQTAVASQFFDSEQDMVDSEAALDGMDPSRTPGTRASIDRGERIVELSA